MDQFDTMPMEPSFHSPGASGTNWLKAPMHGHHFVTKKYPVHSEQFMVSGFHHLQEETVQDPAPQALQIAKDRE